MYRFFFLSFFLSYALYANNPKVYASLGNKIYDNIDNLKNLTSIGEYHLHSDEIHRYILSVEKTKKKGFLIGTNSTPKERREYLIELRKLASQNDFYLRMAEKSLADAIAKGDTPLFLKLINSGIIDMKFHKREIVDYYFKHRKDIKVTGVLKELLEEQTMRKLRAEKEARRRKLQKLRKEERKIRRLRERDKKRQLELEEELEKAVKKRKKEIREKEKEELIKSL